MQYTPTSNTPHNCYTMYLLPYLSCSHLPDHLKRGVTWGLPSIKLLSMKWKWKNVTMFWKMPQPCWELLPWTTKDWSGMKCVLLFCNIIKKNMPQDTSLVNLFLDWSLYICTVYYMCIYFVFVEHICCQNN